MTADPAPHAAAPEAEAEGYRLSPQQESLFRRSAEPTVPRLSLVKRLATGTDTALLAARWSRCVDELEILRTACRTPSWSTVPLQVVEDGVRAPFSVEKLDAGAVPARIAALSRAPVDPAATPAAEARLLVSEDAARLVLSGGAHVLDGDSLVFLAERLTETGDPPEVLQYPDVAEWAASLAEDPDAAAGIAFWRRRAADLRDAPVAFSNEAIDGRGPRNAVVAPWPAAWSGDAPSAAEIAAVALVFAGRCAGAEPACVAVRRDGRDLEDLHGAVGPLARWLPVSVDTGLSAGFGDWRQAAEDDLGRVTDWQHLMEAGLGDAAAPRAAIGLDLRAGWDAAIERLDPEPAAPPLVLRVDAVARRIVLLADAEACDDAQARRLARLFAALADAAAADRTSPVDALDWLDATSRDELLAFGDGPDLPGPTTLVPERIAACVADRGGSLAVIQGEIALTYDELWRRAGAVAASLDAPSGSDERPVAVRLPRGPDALAAMIGAWRAGRPYTPFDPDLPEARLAQMRRTADPAAEIAAPPPVDAARRDLPARAPGDLAYLLFTSGSTGTPKAVAVEHRGLAASTAARTRHYGENPQRFLVVSPLGFDSSVAGLYWTLATGGVVVLPTEEEAEDAGALARLIRERAVTHTLMLPGLYDAVLEAAAPGDLDGLSLVIVAGEPCPRALIGRHRERLPGTRLENEYGPTEATVWCTAARLDADGDGPVPIGVAIPGATARVVDRHLRPLPPGVPGEICIGGPGLARGYAAGPAQTASRFVPDPFAREPGARLYRVGDRGMLAAEGRILYQGRTDNQVKLRGHRIELEEIEARLLADPCVRAAAATVRDGRLVAYVVPRESAPEDDARYRAAVQALPAWMRPQTFVTLEALPRGRTGKLDRSALPAPGQAAGSAVSRAPRDGTERTVAAIWAELLDRDAIGIDDDFFRLGGDSLLALRAATRMRQAGIDASPRLLLKHPTIAGLLAAAPRRPLDRPAAAVTAPAASAGSAPLTPMQAWLVERAGTVPARYDQSLRVVAREPLDLARLERAFAEVVARHDALRMRFEATPEGWRQTPGPAHVDPPLLYDLARVPEAAHSGIEAGAWERLHAGLDPASGRQARLAVIRRGAGGADLLLAVVHHLAIDAASWRIVVEDLEIAYRALESGRSVAWPAAPASFATWATAIRDLPPERLSPSFWANQSAAAVPALPRDRQHGTNREGDVHHVAVTLDAAATDRLARLAPGALSSGLDAVLTATLAETLAAWSGASVVRIDREHHGRADDLVGLSSERTVGWFTTAHPLVLRVPEADGPDRLRALLEQIDRVPDDGFGYGLWANAGADGDVLLNFLGRTDAPPSPDPLFVVEDGATGRERDPDLPRRCLLEIDAEILDGRLRVRWSHAATLHDVGTIDRLASDHLGRLAALAARLNSDEGS
ncbi:amino acid adenylation domain-containing protein [Salinarimonas sp.]|uniref:amino acid adenylation domain-containing protein n=1 Tax=Salinarimonas sp. TaxID=2766526 RepID=UPI0032D8F312